MLARRGRVVVFGSRGSLSLTPGLTMLKEAAILGTALWNATEAETVDALNGVTQKLRDGVIQPVVGERCPCMTRP